MKARHTVLTILFISWIVSYMDRTAMSVAIPYIAVDFHLTPITMGFVMSAFFVGNAISQIPGGFLADKFGARGIATIALLWWSVFTAITGATANFTQMVVARFNFGLGEGLFPASSLKAIAIWFPKAERGTANAIKLAAQPLGAALGLLVISAIIAVWGWRVVFYSMFFPGILVSLLFWAFVRDKPSKNPRVTSEELAELESDGFAVGEKPNERLNVLAIMNKYNIWKYFFVCLAFSLADTGFNSWLPSYLVKVRGFSALQMGAAASFPRFAAVAGCLFGGWLSDKIFKKNKMIPVIGTQLLAAIFLYLIFTVKTVQMLVIFQTLAGFFMMLFFSAFWAIPIKTIPRHLIGVTSGFINMGGQTASFIAPVAIGYLIGAKGRSYDHAFIFMIASLLASCALLIVIPDRRPLPAES